VDIFAFQKHFHYSLMAVLCSKKEWRSAVLDVCYIGVYQGSEWSAEDWTGLASPVESQVWSGGGN